MKRALTVEQLDSYKQEGFFYPIKIFNEKKALEHRHRLELIEKEFGPMHYRTKPYLLIKG